MSKVDIFNIREPSRSRKKVEYESDDETLKEIIKKYDEHASLITCELIIGEDVFLDWDIPIIACLEYGHSISLSYKDINIEVKTTSDETETIEICINNNSKIQELKKAIQKKQRIPLDQQRLLLDGPQLEELENDKKLKEYEIEAYSTIILIPSNLLFVRMKTISDQIINISINPNSTIQELKRAIENKKGIPMNQQILLLDGSQIEELEDHKKLKEYLIESNNFLNLNLKFRDINVFIKISQDKTITMSINPLSTIGEIKRAIQNNEGISMNNLVLMFDGKVLKDNKHLKEYKKIESNSTLDLTYIKPITIFVKSITGKILTVSISQYSTVEELKIHIEEIEGLPIDQQRLIFSGMQLEDGRTLDDYNIKSERLIDLNLRFCGGAVGLFANITEDEQIITVGEEGPNWREITYGLNLEGRCNNDSCEAYNKMVIIQMGAPIVYKFGFPSRIKPFNCPVCSKYVKPETCGFFGCSFRFLGVIETKKSPRKYKSEWKEISKDTYHRYNEDNKFKWISLVIETKNGEYESITKSVYADSTTLAPNTKINSTCNIM